jgi:hypothetical protein
MRSWFQGVTMSALQQAWRKVRYGKPIVVVSGLPRSGTSMAMKMLEAGGMTVFIDEVRTADEDNPKGYFEYERVKDLAQEEDKSWLLGARGQAIKIISYLLKELPPDNNYKVLFMRRHLNEILASQKKMLDRRGETNESSDERMTDIYQNHLWKVGYLMKHSPHIDALDLPYRKVLENPAEQADEINRFLGGGLDVGKMSGVVDSQLYRNRA